MALLSKKKREEYFKYLGLGSYNKTNIKKFQRTAFPSHKNQIDGDYGINTDRALRHWRNVKKYTKDFRPEEFKCTCGKCTGYPSWMRKVELEHLQTIRTHYGKPMKVTSGLRCKHANGASTGSIQNSLHLVGRACDFYMEGVTDTLANRKKAIKYIKTLPNHHYTYGNGINSNGYSVKASYMGNALHTDVNAVKKAKAKTTAKDTAPNANAAKIVELAKLYSWPYGTDKAVYRYSKDKSKCGYAKADYKKALKKYMKKKAKISQTDCGYLVSTCVRASGVASKFLALPGKASDPYPSIPSTMSKVHTGAIGDFKLKPGDIIRYRKTNGHQHTLIFMGDGKIAHAGRSHWFPRIAKAKPWTGKNVKKKTIQVIRAK